MSINDKSVFPTGRLNRQSATVTPLAWGGGLPPNHRTVMYTEEKEKEGGSKGLACSFRAQSMGK